MIGALGKPPPIGSMSSSDFMDVGWSLPRGLHREWEDVKRRTRYAVEASIHDQELFLIKVLRHHSLHEPGFFGVAPTQPLVKGNWVRAACYYNVDTWKSQWDPPEEFTNGQPREEGDFPLSPPPAGRPMSGPGAKAPSESSVVNLRLASFIARARDWWMNLKEPERKGCFARFVQSTLFESVCCVVILAYAGWMVYATDTTIDTLTDELPAYVALCDKIFFCFFCVEVGMRLLVNRLYFFCNDDWTWNLFDIFLLGLAGYEYVVDYLLVNGGPRLPRYTGFTGKATIRLTFLRVVRLMKMVKTLRVLKIFRFVSDLRFMICSVLGSMSSLFWCMLMLLLMFFLFSLAFVQGVGAYLIDAHENIPPEQEEDLLAHFGSVFKSMQTCFRAVTGGSDWGVFYDIIEPTGLANRAIFCFFIIFSQIALLNIVTGVFVGNVVKFSQPDLGFLTLEQRKRDHEDAAKLRKAFQVIDVTGSGAVTAAEFRECIKDDRIRAQLAMLGLSLKDVDMFFRILADISPTTVVDLDFFVEACLKMKGVVASIDVQVLAYETKVMHESLDKLQQEASTAFRELCGGALKKPPPGDSELFAHAISVDDVELTGVNFASAD